MADTGPRVPFTNHHSHKSKKRTNQDKGFVRLIGKVISIYHDADANPHMIYQIQATVDGQASTYRVAVNTHSIYGSDVQYSFGLDRLDEVPEDLTEGITTNDVSLSYSGLGLTQPMFKDIGEGSIFGLLAEFARQSELVIIYGKKYSDYGIHDVHMNSGEPDSSTHPSTEGKDGAIGFYLPGQEGDNGNRFRDRIQWVYIKFATQILPNEN